ncbi:MAG: AMIN domain-containing protein [Rhodospirillales bacterium]|nr:AMIN domain-containing protein [Rhodospirillales bacterium]
MTGKIKSTLAVVLLIILAVMAAPHNTSAAGVVVTDVRVGQHSDKTRFVLDLSKGVEVRIFTLQSPYRIVFDMPEVGWRLPAQPLPSKTGVFKTMRYGLYQPGQSRIVVETTGPVAVKAAFFLPPSGGSSHRFVIDMVPVTKSHFNNSLKQLVAVTPDGGGYSIATQPSSLQASTNVATVPVAKAADTNQVSLAVAPAKPDVEQYEKPVIVIDAGHGGADPGTIGRSGAYEKHITIAAARSIRDALEASGRYKVILTRDRDVFIRLRDRVGISRNAGAKLFISIHADSIKDRNVHGASVYTLSETASDKEAGLLAEKENKADLIGGMDLSGESPEITNILIDLAQRESMNESAQFASILVNKIKAVTKVLKKTHRFAGFAVLKAPDVPSVLVELGFLSNSTDEKNLRSKAFRKKLSRSMLGAIDQYFSQVQQARTN